MKSRIIQLMLIMLSITCYSCERIPHKNKSTENFGNLPFDFNMNILPEPTFQDKTIDIKNFGAIGNGQTDNTRAINEAIKTLSKQGGGTIVIPSGVWLTGPIELANDINLHVEAGALVVFTPDYKKYPIIKTSFEGIETHRCMAPITANGLKNIAITGTGVFEGSGDAWRPVKKDKLTEHQWKDLVTSGHGIVDESGSTWYPSKEYMKGAMMSDDFNNPRNITKEEDWRAIQHFLRPVMVNISNCKNILIKDVTFRNSPSWGIHPIFSENLTIKNVKVFNPWYAQNGDGIDIESCNHVILENSFFDVGDDGICLKSGKDKAGRDLNVPCQNVIIYNCTVLHGHGGFVVGSEMSGGVKNIFVKKCDFIGTDVGLRFKSTRGRGGIVQNIYIEDISMANIKTDVLLFDLFYGGKSAVEAFNDQSGQTSNISIPEVTEETPEFHDITIKNVYCRGARRAMFFNGLPEMKIQNVNVDNVVISSDIGAEIINANHVNMKNVDIISKMGKAFTVSESSDIKINGNTY